MAYVEIGLSYLSNKLRLPKSLGLKYLKRQFGNFGIQLSTPSVMQDIEKKSSVAKEADASNSNIEVEVGSVSTFSPEFMRKVLWKIDLRYEVDRLNGDSRS